MAKRARRDKLAQTRGRATSMNKIAKLATTVTQDRVAPAEWQARFDLASFYRLLAHYGRDDVIYNHSSMRVPGEPRNFLMKRHELLYPEVSESNLGKINLDEDPE